MKTIKNLFGDLADGIVFGACAVAISVGSANFAMGDGDPPGMIVPGGCESACTLKSDCNADVNCPNCSSTRNKCVI